MLIEQMMNKSFKPSNFTVFNKIDDDGYVTQLENAFDDKYSIGDFEYMILDLTLQEKNGVKYYMSWMMNRVRGLKKLIEFTLQDDKMNPKSKVYLDEENYFILIVKMKEFDLIERIKNWQSEEPIAK